MKAMTRKVVYLRKATLQPGTPVNIVKFPFHSLVFMGTCFCGPIVNSVINDLFIKL